jgi:hypothetical protein
VQPIAGRRFECASCPAGPDNDLCEPCYREFERGRLEHPAPASYAKRSGRGAGAEHVFRAHEGLSPERYAPWLAVPRSDARAPSVPDRFVVRPEFRAGRDSFFGAYAFVVDAQDRGGPLVLTALHVMDELIRSTGLDCTAQNHAYSGCELPAVVTEVALYDVFAPNWMFAELGSARSMLVLPQARVGEDEPLSDRDIAAFRVSPAAQVTAGRLAAETPRVGDPTWLVFRQPASSVRTIEAVVVETTSRTLIVRFVNPDETAPYSSGAPLLDAEGAVVGINVGAGRFGGQRFGHANHVGSVRRHLGAANRAGFSRRRT